MGELFRIAYLAELWLWVPLAVIVATVPGMRRWVALPLGVSALALVYEGYMTLVWEPKVTAPIRVDIFLVMIGAGLVDLIAGLALLRPAISGVHRVQARIAVALCLGIVAAATGGWIGMNVGLAAVDEKLDYGRRAKLEAAFRDDETQRRFFGELASRKNPWAGYYVIEGDDDRYRQLVINEAGRVWLFHELLYESRGNGEAGGSDFVGAVSLGGAQTGFVLRREGERYLLRVHGKSLPARRVDPPRYPRAASTPDEVRFIGVFSATYENPRSHPWIVQVWLWQRDGEVWGHYLRDTFEGGEIREYIGTEAIRPRCREGCRVLEFQSGRGPVVLTRVSEDAWRAKLDGLAEEVLLARGETQRGFDLDLAPLSTAKENRRWLDAMTATAQRRK